MSPIRPTAHLVRAVAVRAERDDRTVRAYLDGRHVRDLSVVAIERALRELGREDLIRAATPQQAVP
jgi:hypothetical protein